MATPQPPKTQHSNRKRLLIIVVLVLLLYVLLPQFGRFKDSLQVIRHAHFDWLVIAVGLMLLTFVAAAGVYLSLAKHPLRLIRTIIVQVASMFANRLLPAGVGAIGVNYRFLQRNKHSKAEAGAAVAVNNLVGFMGNALLIAGLVTVTDATWPKTHFHLKSAVYVGIGIAVAIVLLAVIAKLGNRLAGSIRALLRNIASYHSHPLQVVGALICSIVLTSLYGGILYASAHAVGVHLTFAVACIIMSLGVAGGTIIPTPGGLGGAEAGLVAGLVVYGVPGEVALPAALLYRIVTYWLPLVLGGAAFGFVVRRKYI